MEAYGNGERITRLVLAEDDVKRFNKAVFCADIIFTVRGEGAVGRATVRRLIDMDLSNMWSLKGSGASEELYNESSEWYARTKLCGRLLKAVSEGIRQFEGADAAAAYGNYIAGQKMLIEWRYRKDPVAKAKAMEGLMGAITHHLDRTDNTSGAAVEYPLPPVAGRTAARRGESLLMQVAEVTTTAGGALEGVSGLLVAGHVDMETAYATVSSLEVPPELAASVGAAAALLTETAAIVVAAQEQLDTYTNHILGGQ